MTPFGVRQGVDRAFCLLRPKNDPNPLLWGFGKGCEAQGLDPVTWAGFVPVSAAGGLGPRAAGHRRRLPAVGASFVLDGVCC